MTARGPDPPGEGADGSARRQRRRWLALSFVVLTVLVAVGAASAQQRRIPLSVVPHDAFNDVFVDPPERPEQAAESLIHPQVQKDTDSSTAAGDVGFTAIAGRRLDDPDTVLGEGVVRGDECFRDVAFEDDDHGFAVGFRVRDPSDAQDPCAEAEEDKAQTPILYEYDGIEWREVPLGIDSGYLAAVDTYTRYVRTGPTSFDQRVEAFAVGGDGRFPRTEGHYEIENQDDDDPGNDDPAGRKAIVLQLRDGGWQELPECAPGLGGACRPDGMKPLTAVAVAETARSTEPYDPRHDRGGAGEPCGHLVTCHDIERLGVKRAEAVAFFGGASHNYGSTKEPAYRGQVWQWRCLDDDTTPCMEQRSLGGSDFQFYGPEVGAGEGFEPLALTDPASPALWVHPPTFRIRDIDFMSGRRDFGYAVAAGCCSRQDALENLGQIQVWNGAYSEALDELPPGHWWGASYGGGLVNHYELRVTTGDRADGKDHLPRGTAPDEACQLYVEDLRPRFSALAELGFPVAEPFPDWRKQGEDGARNGCETPATRIQFRSNAPTVYAVAPVRSLVERPPEGIDNLLSDAGALAGVRGEPGGFAVGGPDGRAALEAAAGVAASSSFGYGVRRPGFPAAAPAEPDLNHLQSPRDEPLSKATAFDGKDNGFTEFLNAPVFALGDATWDVATRGLGTQAVGWIAGEDVESGRGILYSVKGTGPQAVGTRAQVEQAGGISGGPSDNGLSRPFRFPRRLVTDLKPLHAIEATTTGGWAVGDDGALLRYTDPGSVRNTRLPGESNTGRSRRENVPDRTSYEPFAPVRDGEPGTLPPLPAEGAELPDGRRGFDVLARDEDVDINAVALSADGSEGWGVGDNGDLTYFNGRSWRGCEGQRSCGAVQDRDSPPDLLAIATVPGAEGFEAYAVGAGRSEPNHDGPIEIYKLDDPDPDRPGPGVWRFVGSNAVASANAIEAWTEWNGDAARRRNEPPPLARTEGRGLPATSALVNVRLDNVVAFGPDDVWFSGVARHGRGNGQPGLIYHYGGDGQGWTECTDDGTRFGEDPVSPSRCSDVGVSEAGTLLPVSGQTDLLGVKGSNVFDTVTGMARVGDRLYVAGFRRPAPDVGVPLNEAANLEKGFFPYVIYTDRTDDRTTVDGQPRRVWHNDEAGGGLEPSGRGDPSREDRSFAFTPFAVDAQTQDEWAGFSIGVGADGKLAGWLVASAGTFGHVRRGGVLGQVGELVDPLEADRLIRYQGTDSKGGGRWSFFREPGDVLSKALARRIDFQALSLIQPVLGAGGSLTGTLLSLGDGAPLMAFDGQGWNTVPTPFGDNVGGRGDEHVSDVQALHVTPDGDVYGVLSRGVFRFTRRPVPDSFMSEPLPVQMDYVEDQERNVYAIEAAATGAVWLGAFSDVLARRDPVTGWNTVRIEGWRARGGAPAAVYDLAISPEERGWAVGTGGRVASIDSGGVQLDKAASGLVAESLFGVDVGPDGSALAAGDNGAVLYKPPAGPWERVSAPVLRQGQRVSEVSMPLPGEAWLSTLDGRILHAVRTEEGWRFAREDGGVPAGRAVNSVAVRPDGTGYAVGERGMILERDPSLPAGGRWRERPERPVGKRDLYALEIARRGPGVLVGSHYGDVLSLVGDRFELARRGDPYSVVNFHAREAMNTDKPPLHLKRFQMPMRAIAIVPGTEDGQLEVLAAQARDLYRYTSDRDDPVIGRRELRPLPDVPAMGADDLPIAVFGRPACFENDFPCPWWYGLTLRHQRVLEGIVDDVSTKAGLPDGPELALFTGGVSNDVTDHTRYWGFRDAVLEPLAEAGVPTFAALGLRDVASAGEESDPAKAANRSGLEPTRKARGQSFQFELWKESFIDQPAPWGAPPLARESGSDLRFEPVGEPGGASAVTCEGADPEAPPAGAAADGVELREQAICPEVADPTAGTGTARLGGDFEFKRVKVAGGGARTHYAFDAVGPDGRVRARVAVVNTAQGSIRLSPEDNPVEPTSQLVWLDKVLCRRGSPQDEAHDCTRDPETPAVVLTNRPTYTVTGKGQAQVMQDAAAFEQKLLDNDATVLIVGAIGSNQKYWVTQAAGVYAPAPGSDYPNPGDVPPVARLPVVQSSSAGAPGLEPRDTVDKGGWLGYSIVHLRPPRADGLLSGLAGGVPPAPLPSETPDEAEQAVEDARRCANEVKAPTSEECQGQTQQADVFVENRPVVEDVFITGVSHVMRPGQRMSARGTAVGPLSAEQPQDYMRLTNGSITHRYDLVLADPERPSEPLLDERGEYREVPQDVAEIDRQSGRVRASRSGPDAPLRALVILSMGPRAASYPVTFLPRRSAPPREPEPPVRQARSFPRPVVASNPAARLPQPPAQTPPPTPQVGTPQLPSPPALPNLPTPNAEGITPPTPPVPLPPPVSPAATPLTLAVAPVGLNVAPPTSVVPPPAPPIQPAPPGGARREARQRQAATAKSEQAGSDEAARGEGSAGDNESFSPMDFSGSEATRRERVPPAASFTPLVRQEQPSAWARGALYGGGLTLMALVLAFGWVHGRPTPRRREPRLPAPAWNRDTRRPTRRGL